MTFPTIQFKSLQGEATDDLKVLVDQKFESLEKYVGNETDVTCEVEFEKIVSHQSGRIYRVEANFWLAGNLFRAEATEESFEQAIDAVRQELDTLLRRTSDKNESLFRKGARKVKDMMRFGK
jgi:ribosomal subunit interface protein